MEDNFVPYENEGGVRPDFPDHRDFLYSDVLGAGETPEVDWEKGFDCFEALNIQPITQDQDGSSSCTAQATKSHVRKHLVANGFTDDEISATPIYNEVMLDGGGAYLRDAMAFPATVGSIKESVVSSYENGKPPSEDYFKRFLMTDELKELAEKLELFSYRKIEGGTSSIDLFAHAIQHSQGGIGGYTGTNNGWARSVVQPPQPGEKKWGHAVSHDAFGLMDVPDYGVPVGTKCIFTKNSWGDRYAIQKGRWKGYQAIPESYFNAGAMTAVGNVGGIYVFNAWVLVPDDNIHKYQKHMDFLKQNDGKLVQDSEQTGSFGYIKNGKVLVADSTRVAELLATYLVSKEGLPLPGDMWNEIGQAGLLDWKTFSKK